jgi:hypothetical protein
VLLLEADSTPLTYVSSAALLKLGERAPLARSSSLEPNISCILTPFTLDRYYMMLNEVVARTCGVQVSSFGAMQ